MSYTHLTKTEMVFIEEYYHLGLSARKTAEHLKRGVETICRIFRQLQTGQHAIDIYKQYQRNKAHCGRHKIQCSEDDKAYINDKLEAGWTPDVIIGRRERPLPCGCRTLYRKFHEGVFSLKKLPMKGKRKPRHHKETRGHQRFRRSLRDREQQYPDYHSTFGHLEGDTIIGRHHKSAVLTLVERYSKCIIALKPHGRHAYDIERSLQNWLSRLPRNLFKSITFDNGKEFSNWASISNAQDIDIYFADPGTPSQRGMNEHANGLLRQHGLPKQMDFNKLTSDDIYRVVSRINNIPRKSLGYQTPIECFMTQIRKILSYDELSRLF